MTPVKAILWVLFISCPAILISGYIIYKLRDIMRDNYGIILSDYTFFIILLFTMLGTMWLTSRKVLNYINR